MPQVQNSDKLESADICSPVYSTKQANESGDLAVKSTQEETESKQVGAEKQELRYSESPTVSLGSLFASSESEIGTISCASDHKDDSKNYAADSEDDTNHEDFDFVSPVFLSSSSLSWNIDDPPP